MLRGTGKIQSRRNNFIFKHQGVVTDDIQSLDRNSSPGKQDINTREGGTVQERNDYYFKKNNDNNYYCIAFPDKNISSENYYNNFVRAFNNLPMIKILVKIISNKYKIGL